MENPLQGEVWMGKWWILNWHVWSPEGRYDKYVLPQLHQDCRLWDCHGDTFPSWDTNLCSVLRWTSLHLWSRSIRDTLPAMRWQWCFNQQHMVKSPFIKHGESRWQVCFFIFGHGNSYGAITEFCLMLVRSLITHVCIYNLYTYI